MKTVLKSLAFLAISNVGFSQFNATKEKYHIPLVEFKDGTVLKNVNIRFVMDDKPSSRGIILQTADNRVYFHDYPYCPPVPIYKDVMPDDGSYKSKKVLVGYRHIEHYKPPKFADFNPTHIPQCCPSRVPFIHFKKSTLNELYKAFEPMSRGKKSFNYDLKETLTSIRSAAWHKPKAFEMNTLQDSTGWRKQLELEMRFHWNKIFYGRWLRRK